MVRRFCLVLLTLVTVACIRADVRACGDKFLRVARSARFRAYASLHPSSILVYAPRWTNSGIQEFERILKRGGHRPVTVMTAEAMSQAFAGGKYDLVITSYQDAAAVSRELDGLASRPALLPVVYKARKAETAAAEAAYRCVLKPDRMTQIEALEEVDRLLELRRKDAAPAAPVR